MRGELDDALAWMTRREELLRRTAEQSAVDEVTEAVRRIVARHPDVVVRLSVQDGPVTTPVLVSWSAGAVRVTHDPAAGGAAPTPPASVPLPAPVAMPPRAVSGQAATGRVRRGPAARLAELIRRDPSLLDGPEGTD